MNIIEMNDYRNTEGGLAALFLLCLLLSLVSISGIAQEEIIRYSASDGLSSNTVYAMEMDHEGYLWVGTYHGLNRFDGRDFKQYFFGDIANRHTDQVTDIYLDSYDRLWVSTKGGLYLYDELEDSFHKVNSDKINVSEIAEDASGSIWVLGFDAFILDESSMSLKEVRILGEKDYKIEAILFDPYGDVWLGWYGGGLTQCAYNGMEEPYTLRIKRAFSSSGDEKMKSDIVRELLLDDQRRLWFTTYKGLNWISLDPDQSDYSVEGFSNELSDGRYWSVIQDANGNIWAGTYGNGLFMINSNLESQDIIVYLTDLFNPSSISCNEIHSVFEDIYQNIWIATENGLNKILNKEISYTTYQNIPDDPSSIASNHVFEIVQDATGKIWMGTPTSLSVTDYNLKPLRFENLKLPGLESVDNFVFSILPDSGLKQFYIGTKGGLYSYEFGGKAQKIEGIVPQAHSIVTVQDIAKTGSTLWVATDDGVYAYDSLMNYPVFYSDFGRQPLDCKKMLYSKDGSLWLATDNGLKRIMDPRRV